LTGVVRLQTDDVTRHAGPLAELLIDAVDSGASVGFLPPLSREDADAYWRTVAGALTAGHRILLAVFDAAGLAGSVQLDLPAMPNGAHRAEVVKLFVHRRARGRGLARALMAAVEAEARQAGRTLLVLDTRAGDAAERLYEAIGYVRAGTIPRYARSASGELHATVFLYRWLE
jgi:acetyltransferase